MRAPWTALRDARAEIANETDERGELLRLRRERIELRAVAAVASVGLIVMVAVSGRHPATDGGPIPGPLILLLVMMVAWFFSHSYARAVHGDAVSPEAARADALRGLVMFPLTLALAAAVYWFMSGDLRSLLIWLAFFAPAMAVAMYVRYRRTARDVQLAAEHDEGADRRD